MTDLQIAGFICKTENTGEYDRELTVFTPERGFIKVYAKGARRPNARYGSEAAPFTCGVFQLGHGRMGNSCILKSYTATHTFPAVADVPAHYALACYMISAVMDVSRKELPDRELFDLLLAGIYETERIGPILPHRRIRNTDGELIPPGAVGRPIWLVKSGFEAKLASISGILSLCLECADCGRELPDNARGDIIYDTDHSRGCRPLCAKCAANVGHSGSLLVIPPNVAASLRYAAEAPSDRFASLPCPPADSYLLMRSAEATALSLASPKTKAALDYYRTLAFGKPGMPDERTWNQKYGLA